MSGSYWLADALQYAPLMARVSKTPTELGFDDAFSICPMVWALVLFLFLIHFVRNTWASFMAILIFVSLQIMGMISLIYGGLDQYLIRPPIESAVRIFWFAIGFLLIGFGSIYARDWQALRKSDDAKLWIGFPGGDPDKPKSSDMFIVNLFFSVFYVILAGGLGALAVFSSAFALQDYDVFIATLDLAQSTSQKEALRESLAYVGAYLTPCILAGIVAIVFNINKSMRNLIYDRMVAIKMTFALILTALGAGSIIIVL